MEDKKDRWINDVLKSTQGSQRAKPKSHLFAKIQANVKASEAKIVSIGQQRLGIAAALLLLVLNIFVVSQYIQNEQADSDVLSLQEKDPTVLILDFNFYGNE